MSSGHKVRAIISFVEQYGFKLVRQKKHLVFIHYSGLKLVTSKSASDHRALKNIKSTIDKLLQTNGNSNHTS